MSSIISIVVPCYNQAQYLDECLQSVLDQTYQNWECIIVNDGSPDNTEEVAMEWVEKDNRFKYFRKENGGVASARNFGIERAQNEWILPLDGDDKINTDYLKLASEKFLGDYSVIYCEGEYFGKKSGRIPAEDYDGKLMLRKNLIFCSGFFRKEDWKKCGGFDSNMKYGLEDWEFWINLLKNTDRKPLKLNYIGFYYRIKELSRNSSMHEGRDTIMINYIVNKHQDIYEKYFGTYYTLVNRAENLQLKIDRLYQSKNYKLYSKLRKLLG